MLVCIHVSVHTCTETIEEKLAHRRLEWLGHVARMEDSRMPGKFCLVLSCSAALPTDPGRDGKMVLSGTCGLVICLLLGLTWHVSPGRRGVARIPLWLVTSIACRLLSALYVIGLLLALVIELGTSVRRRGLDQSRIRRQLGIVIVVIVGFEVRVEWLSIIVVVRRQSQLLV